MFGSKKKRRRNVDNGPTPLDMMRQALEAATTRIQTLEEIEMVRARKDMEEKEKKEQAIMVPIVQQALIITASNHGVLQDRLNNWLKGDYGRLISTSMSINGKGFYLTVVYEPKSEPRRQEQPVVIVAPEVKEQEKPAEPQPLPEPKEESKPVENTKSDDDRKMVAEPMLINAVQNISMMKTIANMHEPDSKMGKAYREVIDSYERMLNGKRGVKPPETVEDVKYNAIKEQAMEQAKRKLEEYKKDIGSGLYFLPGKEQILMKKDLLMKELYETALKSLNEKPLFDKPDRDGGQEMYR